MWWQQHQSRSADRWTACIWTVWCTAGVAQFYFRFRIGWRHFLQKVNVYQHTEYRQDNSIHDRDITISVLQKETSAILKFFFRCWLWPHRRNPHDILQKNSKFRPNRISHCGNMTSYPFLKMAAAEYYFRFRICWSHCLQKVKIYQKTKFRRLVSIQGWNITTSVIEKETSSLLEFYFRFRYRPFRRNLHRILHPDTEFRRNRSTHCGNMMSYPFLKMAAAAAQYYFRFNICWYHCF